jgi:excinuclease ABC subunit C
MSENKINLNISNDDIDLEEKLKNLPIQPGIYQFKNEQDKVIYVGKAANLKSRVRSYFHHNQSLNPKIRALVSKVKNLEIIVTDSEVEALILESNLVKSLKPRYNIQLKDDKSYPYIVITNEPYPQVYPTRKTRQDGSKYFGPFTEVKVMKSALKVIRDIFMVRNCKYYMDEDVIKKRKVKLCLEYQIKKCGGPCEGLISYEEYQKVIKNVEKLLNGKTSDIINSLSSEMQKASDNLRFEDATILKKKIELLRVYSSRQKVVSLDIIDRDIFALAFEDEDACAVIFKIRDGKLIDKRHYYISNIKNADEREILENVLKGYYLQTDFIPNEIFLQSEIEDIDIIKKWLEDKKRNKIEIKVPRIGENAKLISMCRINARYLLDELKIQKMKKDNYIPYSLKSLQKDLHLSVLPRRIECFDISNIQGSDSVASMITFIDGKAKKSDYRKFKINSVNGPNDFESIKEVIYRRYKRVLEEKLPLPDLIIVDGGKGQLSSALKSLEDLNLSKMSIIGLAKRLEEIFIPGINDAQMLPKTSSSLKLLQNIRDEAHRFAITFHREKREKRIISTELGNIESIGPVRANKLLAELGSVEAIKNTDIKVLSRIVGKSSAEKINNYFQNKGL